MREALSAYWMRRKSAELLRGSTEKEHILDRQYLLSLHGHIHESPLVNGRWCGELGRTTCVQPGAWPPLPVLVDLDAGFAIHQTFGKLEFRKAG